MPVEIMQSGLLQRRLRARPARVPPSKTPNPTNHHSPPTSKVSPTTPLLAVRWSAPELLTGSPPTPSSDAWSYGVVLHEMYTHGDRPYSEWDNARVVQEVGAGYRLPRPHGCPKTMYDVMVQCWAQSGERPEFGEVLGMMSSVERKISVRGKRAGE